MNNPAMRFKRDDGTVFPDWSSSEIGNVADTCSGGTPSTSVSEYWDGPIQWLTPTEINSKYVHNSKRTITSAGIASSSAKLLPIGALLLTTRATIGACSINNFDGDVSTNQGFQSLICKSSLFNEYAYYAITRDKFQKELIKHSSGSTFLEISSKNLKKLPIPIPCLEEQQKIASFFSTLDQKIELNERKLEALEKLKKGVMQKCFNNSNWTKHQLKDVCKSFSGGTPNSKNRSFYNGEIPFIRSGEIHQNITELSVTTEAVKNSSAKLVKSGDLLYALYGANSGDCDLSKINGAINQAILCIRPKSDNIVDMLFLKEQLFHLKSKITSKYLQGGQGNLSGRLVMNLSILLPPYIKQLTYSSLFGSINNKIEITKQKLFLLQKLKQGLMQQMFI